MANFLQDAAQAVATGTDIDVLLIMLFRYFAGITVADVQRALMCLALVSDGWILDYSPLIHLRRSATGRDGAELIADDTRQV